jgi:hypothetical protein
MFQFVRIFKIKVIMKISYAIPVCNEFVEIQRLITFLLENKRQKMK